MRIKHIKPPSVRFADPACLWMCCASILMFGVFSPLVEAQLAITEVMSSASTNCSTSPLGNADFWELTNFGTNIIRLDNYRFADSPVYTGAYRLSALSIAPYESMIFVRSLSGTLDEAAFRAWWGDDQLPADLQIIFYDKSYGFSSAGEMVVLWDPATNVIDQAVFGEAVRGRTFTYETNCGQFGEVSEPGVNGVFQAATCPDIGSPGKASAGPVKISITLPLENQYADGGMDVTLTIRACGLPRPLYRWFHAGTNLPGETAPDLVIKGVTPVQAGEYYVQLSNGLELITTTPATLFVNTNPAPARLDCPPVDTCNSGGNVCLNYDQIVFPGQTAAFSASVRGYPPPAVHWSWSPDGVTFSDLSGQTSASLKFPNVQPTNSGWYRIFVQNPSGSASEVAHLTVKAKPQLKITEAMASPCSGLSRDWWELTNIGTEPVNLCGYRWDDQPGIIGGGPTISIPTTIYPGESIVLIQNQSKESFIQLWGAENLPPNLQFISYSANGFDSIGDEINLWNPAAIDDHDYVDSVGFSTATPGVSFLFDTFVCLDADGVELDTQSVDGECGAFRAADGCDVGSPGWTRWTPPSLTAILREGSSVKLAWKAQPGATCVLESTSTLGASSSSTIWQNAGSYSFSTASCAATVSVPLGENNHFFRLRQSSSAPCSCPPP